LGALTKANDVNTGEPDFSAV